MPLAVFLASFIFLNLLQHVYRDKAIDGVYFQEWTSDFMGQTLPAEQLKKTPLLSLWYLHKQPPALDIIRGVTTQFYRGFSGKDLLIRLDRALYVLWASFFALMAGLIYAWLRRLSSNTFALAASAVWILHPASINYSMLLEGTLLSSLCILWFFYELCHIGRKDGSILRLLLVSVLLFYLRTTFQWYFFPLLIISLIAMGVPRAKLFLFTVLTVSLILPFIAKQYLMFKTTSTTTFAGYHKCGIIRYNPTRGEIDEIRTAMDFSYPEKADLYNGADGFNTRGQYENNLIYSEVFNRQLKTNTFRCVRNILRSFVFNFKIYWRPSAQYQINYIVRRLYWARFYNFLFSGWRFVFLLFCASLIWTYTRIREGKVLIHFNRAAGIMIPLTYIFLVTNLSNRYNWLTGDFNWVEADRLKFFLEPVFYVFIMNQAYHFISSILNKPNRNKERAQAS